MPLPLQPEHTDEAVQQEHLVDSGSFRFGIWNPRNGNADAVGPAAGGAAAAVGGARAAGARAG